MDINMILSYKEYGILKEKIFDDLSSCILGAIDMYNSTYNMPLLITDNDFKVLWDPSDPFLSHERCGLDSLMHLMPNVTVRGAPLPEVKRSRRTWIKTKTSKPPTGGASL